MLLKCLISTAILVRVMIGAVDTGTQTVVTEAELGVVGHEDIDIPGILQPCARLKITGGTSEMNGIYRDFGLSFGILIWMKERTETERSSGLTTMFSRANGKEGWHIIQKNTVQHKTTFNVHLSSLKGNFYKGEQVAVSPVTRVNLNNYELKLQCGFTKSPTLSPTNKPTKKPTITPTKNPTNEPTSQPTKNPTLSPTKKPTLEPTSRPTEICHGLEISDGPSVLNGIYYKLNGKKNGRYQWGLRGANTRISFSGQDWFITGSGGINIKLAQLKYFYQPLTVINIEFKNKEYQLFLQCHDTKHPTMVPTTQPTQQPTQQPTNRPTQSCPGLEVQGSGFDEVDGMYKRLSKLKNGKYQYEKHISSLVSMTIFFDGKVYMIVGSK